MAFFYIALAVISLIVLIKIATWKRPLANMPGPPGLPLLGNILQLKTTGMYLRLTSWAREYGPVYGLNLAGQPVVVISHPDAMHEEMVTRGRDFAGRIISFRSTQFDRGFVLQDPGPMFHFQKKLLLRQLRGYGDGFEQIEKIVMKEMEIFTGRLRGLCDSGKAMLRLDDQLERCLVNISWILMFGVEPEASMVDVILELNKQATDLFMNGLMGQLFDAMPWLRFFGHPHWKLVQKIHATKDKLYSGLKRITDEGRQSGKDMSCTNLLHAMCDVMEGDNTVGLEEEDIRVLLVQLYFSSTSTTSNTMRTLIANVILHPEVQQALRRESETYLAGRPVHYRDRVNMPYHHATILEITRYAPVVTLPLPHKALTDSQIMSYKIPKGTMILNNVWAIHHDEALWDDPYTFNPSRYLTEDGELVPADHPARINNVAFGAGIRGCPGETFANARMFLVLATLIQHFELLPATTLAEQPRCECLDMVDGLIMSPPPYQVRMEPRYAASTM